MFFPQLGLFSLITFLEQSILLGISFAVKINIQIFVKY